MASEREMQVELKGARLKSADAFNQRCQYTHIFGTFNFSLSIVLLLIFLAILDFSWEFVVISDDCTFNTNHKIVRVFSWWSNFKSKICHNMIGKMHCNFSSTKKYSKKQLLYTPFLSMKLMNADLYETCKFKWLNFRRILTIKNKLKCSLHSKH